MHIAFRVDASAALGGGHVMRCLTLAETLRGRGARVQMITRTLAGDLNDLLRARGLAVSALPALATAPSWADDAAQTLHALADQRPDGLVVDHYALDHRWERLLRPQVRHLAVIDDLADRDHDCDLLLDQNDLDPGAGRYTDRVPAGCRLLLGPQHALLRPDFARLRAGRGTPSGHLARVLVFFSGGDDLSETLKALQGIALSGLPLAVDAVVGLANPQREAVAQFCARQGWAYHCQTDQMAQLMAQADLVLGSAGSSSWERCALGVPSLVCTLADNQRELVDALSHAQAARALGWGAALTAQDYADALRALRPADLIQLAHGARAMTDGAGSDRVADALQQILQRAPA